jgi:hypothetical protein
MGMGCMVPCSALDTRLAVVGSVLAWGLQMNNAWMVGGGCGVVANQGLRCEMARKAHCACGEPAAEFAASRVPRPGVVTH